MSIYPQILGVYSQAKEAELGTGSTQGQYDQVTYWYVRRLNDSDYEVQPLNAYHVPSGICTTLAQNDFATQYSPEPTYYEVHTQPALKSLEAKIAKGEEEFAKGNLDEAERSFLKALMIDDLNVPANLGVGAVYTEKKEFDKLKKTLKILLNQDATFAIEQRQRFNTLGMSLRKQGLHEEALAYYLKALENSQEDENLHFNVARVYFEKGDQINTIEHLGKCLAINPDLEVAQKFMRYCEKNFK
ncbi:tetratricopeptide repeat protein [Desulfovibrio ferrophilus]|uniref:Tetratricopeptide TPR_1 repeat-containing protein n=1 Tax=Desulfovibrio ferrophilus TaxID=241368 RepID=A0A2Z6AUM2_9BACT|nr:hypothetical protein [Desulfovibrio ferrophilus]BBD06886.1 tetratricopeptide TPR_1 repeat-containing protein [Desulfovibrio ferrophilus]